MTYRNDERIFMSHVILVKVGFQCEGLDTAYHLKKHNHKRAHLQCFLFYLPSPSPDMEKSKWGR